MARSSALLVALTLMLTLASCTSLASFSAAPSANPSGPRALILDGKLVSEDDVGGFTSWYCRDYVDDDRVLVEAGFLAA